MTVGPRHAQVITVPERYITRALASLPVTLLATAVVGSALAVVWPGTFRHWWLVGACTCVVLFDAFDALVLASRRQRSTSIELGARGLVVTKGAFVRSTRVIPRLSVSEVSVVRGAIDRRFDLAQVVLVSAAARIELPKIDTADAERIANWARDEVA